MCTAAILVALAGPLLAQSYSVPLGPAEWTGGPEAVQPEGAALRFASRGPVAQVRSSRWTRSLKGADFSRFHYVVLEYKAQWLEERPEVLSLDGSKGSKPVPLAAGMDLIQDGRWHKLVARKDLPRPANQLLLTLASRDSRCYMVVRSLRFVVSPSDAGPALRPDASTSTRAAFRSIGLGKQFDSSWDRLFASLLERPLDGMVNDSGAYFRAPEISISGVPFRVRTTGDNLVSPSPPPAANNDIIDNYGVKVERRKVAPLSRDSRIEIAVNAPATEVYLLLAAEFPSKRRQSAGGTKPMSIDDVEWFAIELDYADGSRDMAFPYSLEDGRHVIERMLGAYVVPASGGALKRVVLHNRMLTGNVHLAAVTVNTGRTRLFPQLMEPPVTVVRAPAEPPARAPYARRSGNVLSLGNRYIDVSVDISKAFAITSLQNRWLGPSAIAVAPRAGLEVWAAGKHLAPGDLELAAVRNVPHGFEVTYRARGAPLELIASVLVDEAPEARFLLTVISKAPNPLDVNIRFPKVDGMRMGANADLWYMFPKYRNALGKAPATYYSGAGCPFPLQFYDIFNPRLGGGVVVLTRELNNRAQRYYLSKSDSGASFFIEHPQLYTHLQPGQRYHYTETAIGVHPGDWHTGFERYRRWLATWYRPFRSQQDSKAWYRQLFWLVCDYADDVNPDAVKLPAWYDAAKKHYRMRDILSQFEKFAGARPDLLHFWGWTWDPSRWGVYGEPNYRALGGRENFRAALDDIRDNLHTPVSLYIDAELCSHGNQPCDSLGPAFGMRERDGRIQDPLSSYRMCHYTRQWQEYMKTVYPRVYRETGAKILYVDELSSPGFECWGKDHGHGVPLNFNEADYALLKAIREATPAEVALYGEYPATDVASQYWDCNISYYNVGYGEVLGRTYDRRPDGEALSPACLDLYRFALPRVVQLVLPMAINESSWHNLKFIFFNGQAHYDSFWDRYESRGQEFMDRAFRIKKQYADCFTSGHPEMLVATEQTGILANKWPGKRRTVWTLYNQRYHTARGRLLEVPDVKGATYLDLWDGKPLMPEVRGGQAYLSLEMDPQAVGAVAQILP